MFKVILAATLCLALTACSNDDKGEARPFLDLKGISNKIKHNSKECPDIATGKYCRPNTNLNSDAMYECISLKAVTKADGILLFQGVWANSFIADGQVKTDSSQGVTVDTLAYCTVNTLHLYLSGPGFSMHESYSTSPGGAKLHYESFMSSDVSASGLNGEYTFMN